MASMTVHLSLFLALLFIVLSSQPVYKITSTITRPLKLRLADSAGNASRAGLVVHALVFFGIAYAYARANNI